jgi:hypothetical protein
MLGEALSEEKRTTLKNRHGDAVTVRIGTARSGAELVRLEQNGRVYEFEVEDERAIARDAAPEWTTPLLAELGLREVVRNQTDRARETVGD